MERLRYQAEKKTLNIIQQVQRTGPKPSGLWYSVGDEWKRWCEAEEFRTDTLAVVYRLIVDEGAILRLTTESEIRAFTARFRLRDTAWQTWDINWPRIAREWAGIEIAPYQWGCRLDTGTRWYSGWDVASGCIWDSRALLDNPKLWEFAP